MQTEVPFRLVGGAQPLAVVPAWLNGGGPYWFALDTGAGPCVVSSRTAARASVSAKDGRPAHGVGSAAAVKVGRLDALRVGDAEQADVQVAVTDEVERVAAAVASPLDGILGHAFLGRYDLEVDYARDTLTLREPGSGPDSEGSDRAVVSFRLAHPSKPLILVEARFGPSVHLLVAVDTGASTTVVDQESADRLGIARRASSPITGAGGTSALSMGRLESLAIGEAEVRDLDVGVLPGFESLSRVIGAEIHGIVGYNFLREFIVTIEYGASRLRLRRPARR